MALLTKIIMVSVVWAKDHNNLIEYHDFALASVLFGLITALYTWKVSRIVMMGFLWVDLALSNYCGIGQVSPCFRKAHESEVDNGVCKLQVGLASAMLVHLTLTVVIVLTWWTGEHPSRGILRALRTGRARREETVGVGRRVANWKIWWT